MFWKKKDTDNPADDAFALRSRAKNIIEKNRADEFLFILACMTNRFESYQSDFFKKNNPDYPWNFGVKEIKISKKQIPLPENILEGSHPSYKPKLSVISGKMLSRNFSVCSYNGFSNGVFASLSLDGGIAITLTYDFGENRNINLSALDGQLYKIQYHPGLTKPLITVHEFHNEKKPIEFLKLVSKEIEKTIEKQRYRLEQSLKVGKEIQNAEARKKITF